MCCKGYWKGIAAFVLALALSLLVAGIFSINQRYENLVGVNIRSNEGSDHGRTYSDDSQKMPKIVVSDVVPLVIISKQRASYTDEAKRNLTQGKVVLRVTFNSNGTIGAITTVSALPDGLTEQAIEAAKNIKFEPATRNGTPISVTKSVEYSFTIY